MRAVTLPESGYNSGQLGPDPERESVTKQWRGHLGQPPLLRGLQGLTRHKRPISVNARDLVVILEWSKENF